MKTPLELKGLILGIISGLAAVSIAFATGEMLQRQPTTTTVTATTGTSGAAAGTAGASGTNGVEEVLVIPPAGTTANKGYKLFMLNCAHCHGTDARGDEGPDLHGVRKSDQRLTKLIQNGVKGEMPNFGTKLTDADVQALIAFLRTLKD